MHINLLRLVCALYICIVSNFKTPISTTTHIVKLTTDLSIISILFLKVYAFSQMFMTLDLFRLQVVFGNTLFLISLRYHTDNTD